MKEQVSLSQTFDEKESTETIVVPSTVEEAFVVPTRNWNGIIDDYNTANKKNFQLTALQCKSIIEHVKRGIPAQYMFKSLGLSKPRYNTLVSSAGELEERFEVLYNKQDLSEEETEDFQRLLRHPLRILMMDVLRAEGVSDLLDWEAFNKKAIDNPEILAMKMKAKFKDMFSERQSEAAGINVQIRLGGDDDWINKV